MNAIKILEKAISRKHPCDDCHAALEQLEQALKDAIWAADYLADQQAIPDDGYKARLESARRVLS